jgi:response regulator RpfG family c-di-GMP phosphodiesterase
MEKALLVYDHIHELNFFQTKLEEDNVIVYKSDNLNEALLLAETVIPSLVVINAHYSEDDIVAFCKKVKSTDLSADITILSLVESENYYASPYIDHLMVKPIRPKLLLSIIRALIKHENVSWVPEIH